jgi:small-conductance mechanosensitive channel
MGNWVTWIQNNWVLLVTPSAIFILTLIALLWLRRLALTRLLRHAGTTPSSMDRVVAQAVNVPSIIWCLIISAYLAVTASSMETVWRTVRDRTLWSLLVISATVSVLLFVRSVADVYGHRARLSLRTVTILKSLARVWILIIAALILLDIWGAPTSPIILLIAVVVLVAALALRDAVPNAFAGMQLAASQKIRIGDYVRLETGEEGHVVEFTWNTTQIRSLEGNLIMIPNSRLVGHSVVNYGQPLKKAEEPFRFYSRAHVTELTGLKARNLRELRDLIKTATDAMIYYHTHHFVEEHHFLVPEPSNDFAYWTASALGDNSLSERLAAVNIMDFASLSALKERFLDILDEYLSLNGNSKDAAQGMEFYLMKSIAAIMPTPYGATDLREFVEALRKVSESSIYFHLFESRLRLGRGQNDFSAWLENSLGETELAEEIARLDIYSSTLEAIRSTLIQLIEKRIK